MRLVHLLCFGLAFRAEQHPIACDDGILGPEYSVTSCACDIKWASVLEVATESGFRCFRELCFTGVKNDYRRLLAAVSHCRETVFREAVSDKKFTIEASVHNYFFP